MAEERNGRDVAFEMRSVMKYLVSQGRSSHEIYERLQLVYKEKCLSKSTVMQMCERFKASKLFVPDDKKKLDCIVKEVCKNGTKNDEVDARPEKLDRHHISLD